MVSLGFPLSATVLPRTSFLPVRADRLEACEVVKMRSQDMSLSLMFLRSQIKDGTSVAP